jgi:mono/diheme cytochrome c family protein
MRSVGPVVGLLLLAVCSHAADDATGARLYAERCSGCHGDHGHGDGPAAAALVPKPRNFVDAAFWKDHTLAQVKATVTNGKPPMMPGFVGVLSDAEIDAVARFVQRFDPGAGK